jgi:hypothetical protein
VLAVALAFGMQAFKFGPQNAHVGLARVGARWAHRAAGLVASHEGKPWVTAEGGRVARAWIAL